MLTEGKEYFPVKSGSLEGMKVLLAEIEAFAKEKN
jgi:hypothetical protein